MLLRVDARHNTVAWAERFPGGDAVAAPHVQCSASVGVTHAARIWDTGRDGTLISAAPKPPRRIAFPVPPACSPGRSSLAVLLRPSLG